MVTNIDLGTVYRKEIVFNTAKASAVAQLARVIPTTSPRDVVIASINLKARFHDGASPTPKVIDDVSQVRVAMGNAYLMVGFVDDIGDDPEGVEFENAVRNELPASLGALIDEVIFGIDQIPGSPFTGLTNEAIVSATSASWTAAVDSIASGATGWVINSRKRALVRSAVLQGATGVNALQIATVDGGMTLAGLPVFFRDLGASGPVGVVGNFKSMAVVVSQAVKSEIHKAEDGLYERLQNRDTLYVGTRIGVGISSQADFAVLVES